ncbi:uncharacterized protein LOC129324873 [Eublepharis macularius]|uniref:Uncharacterized protein LOC129324873 n=1 Tax=Eublepharis macularius TaxID=481883 RepID=A0AA97KS48_EUBMA|nr:uncharacterized protein LOC129324873 [Eublepharis macularius]
MPPKKGGGPSKGKQPVKRLAPKKPPPTLSSSDDEDGPSRQELMERMAALEKRAAGLAVGGDLPQPRRGAKRVAKVGFNKEFASRLLALEKMTALSTGEPSSSHHHHPTAPEAEGEGYLPGPGDCGQVAVAVDSPLAEGAVSGHERRRILICGHSMVFWAANQAKNTPIGSQLGLSAVATVEWQGRRGLRWPGLLPLLFRGRLQPPPHIVVIHLGGNDLGMVQGKALSVQVAVDLAYINDRWPGVLVIWSEMLQRRVWREALNPKAIERARRKTNHDIRKALGQGLGIYLPHPRIRAEFANLYRGDGVHMSPEGNELFLDDLRQGLRVALGHLWGARV